MTRRNPISALAIGNAIDRVSLGGRFGLFITWPSLARSGWQPWTDRQCVQGDRGEVARHHRGKQVHFGTLLFDECGIKAGKDAAKGEFTLLSRTDSARQNFRVRIARRAEEA